MPPRCIVTDLDRTLTGPDLLVDEAAIDRIRTLRKRGVRVVIATGRRLEELGAMGLTKEVDGIVAENGAIVSIPHENVLHIVHADFAQLAREALGSLATRFQWGRVVGSGPRELDLLVRQRLAAGKVGHSLEFNAEHVMILPEGVSKASGAEICLRHLDLTAGDAWAIGDGENDASLLRWASVGAAPGNAARATKEAADLLIVASYSRGFLELTEPILGSARGPIGGDPPTVQRGSQRSRSR